MYVRYAQPFMIGWQFKTRRSSQGALACPKKPPNPAHNLKYGFRIRIYMQQNGHICIDNRMQFSVLRVFELADPRKVQLMLQLVFYSDKKCDSISQYSWCCSSYFTVIHLDRKWCWQKCESSGNLGGNEPQASVRTSSFGTFHTKWLHSVF